jgi:hypothetical protein
MTSDYRLGSRTVDWWSVHLYVAPFLLAAASWQIAGTLGWQQLADDDPVKRAALYDAARHHALRVETCQAALAGASRDISVAADWSGLARNILQRSGVWIPRRPA